LPHYNIDALVRVHDIYRYDDREHIQTNLIDAYDKLMDFIAKHLPDRFYMIGDQRVSLRSKIFREIVGNLIVHREYMDAYPCSLVIHKDKVETANANNPHGEGPIDPKNFTPFPKNPVIANFFTQLGCAEKLGSGVLNVNKFIKEYSGKNTPLFIEGPVFKMQMPVPRFGGLNEVLNGPLNGPLSGTLNEQLKFVYSAIQQNPGIQANEISILLNNRPIRTIKRQLKVLFDKGLIERRGSKKTGGYFIKDSTP
jgi:ATP-dependent DNA helicase RecG